MRWCPPRQALGKGSGGHLPTRAEPEKSAYPSSLETELETQNMTPATIDPAALQLPPTHAIDITELTGWGRPDTAQ